MLYLIFLFYFQEMNLKAEDMYLRKPDFLDAHGIEVWTEKEVQEQLSSVLNGWSRPCRGEGMPRRASHGMGAMPGRNESAKELQGQAKPRFFPMSLGFSSQSSSILIVNHPPRLRPGR